MKYKNVCIIPARSGSKRIKNKNIRIIGGKPLISHVINICKKAKVFDRIIVSTDSKIIKKIALKYKVEVPNLRPQKYSNDNASINSVIKYLFKKLKFESMDYLYCVFPTAILLEPIDIKNSLKKIIAKKADHLLTLSQYKSPIERSIYIKKNKLNYLNKNKINKKTQNLKKYYFDTGSFFIHKVNSYKKRFNDKPKNSIAYFLDEFKCVDVNDKNDLKLLEILFKNKK